MPIQIVMIAIHRFIWLPGADAGDKSLIRRDAGVMAPENARKSFRGGITYFAW